EPDGEVPEGLLRARHDPLGSLVARGGGRVHPGRVVDAIRLGDEASCCERLDAPVASATAARSLERDGKVTDLARRVRRAAQQTAVDDDVLRAGARRDALVAADDARHGIVVTRDDASDVRPAEIDAEIEAQTLGSLPATSGAFSAERSLLKTCCCAALYPFFALSFP